jgi:hypothetical protein
MSAPLEQLRCAQIDGEPGRRKTAFAHALGHALGYEQVLYHEIVDEPLPPTPVRLPVNEDDETGAGEAPVQALDRVLSEACAHSEGSRTALVLDQLQNAPFREHLRIAEFIRSGQWSYGDIALKAHRRKLLLLLVSEGPLFHSIRQRAFRIWVAPEGAEGGPVTPQRLGLGVEAEPLLAALAAVFETLNVAPSLAEYQRLMHDIHANVHTAGDLRSSIFGWVEDVDHRLLHAPQTEAVLERHWPAVSAYLGLDANAPTRIVLTDAGESP